jgi:hypothetical protein
MTIPAATSTRTVTCPPDRRTVGDGDADAVGHHAQELTALQGHEFVCALRALELNDVAHGGDADLSCFAHAGSFQPACPMDTE